MKITLSLFDFLAAAGYVGLAVGLYFVGWPWLVCFLSVSLMAAGVAGQRGYLTRGRGEGG